jgi:hypothetical protein
LSDKLREILTEARAIIAERGVLRQSFTNLSTWDFDQLCQNRAPLPPEACFCTAGAIHYAAGSFYDDSAIEYLGQFLPEKPGADASRVYAFNDEYADKPEVILAVFDDAIESLSE